MLSATTGWQVRLLPYGPRLLLNFSDVSSVGSGAPPAYGASAPGRGRRVWLRGRRLSLRPRRARLAAHAGRPCGGRRHGDVDVTQNHIQRSGKLPYSQKGTKIARRLDIRGYFCKGRAHSSLAPEEGSWLRAAEDSGSGICDSGTTGAQA